MTNNRLLAISGLILLALPFVSASFQYTQPSASSITTNNYINNSYQNITNINGSSFNQSYADYAYNHTSIVFDTWGQYFYNMSDGSYNSSYAQCVPYAYNQTFNPTGYAQYSFGDNNFSGTGNFSGGTLFGVLQSKDNPNMSIRFVENNMSITDFNGNEAIRIDPITGYVKIGGGEAASDPLEVKGTLNIVGSLDMIYGGTTGARFSYGTYIDPESQYTVKISNNGDLDSIGGGSLGVVGNTMLRGKLNVSDDTKLNNLQCTAISTSMDASNITSGILNPARYLNHWNISDIALFPNSFDNILIIGNSSQFYNVSRVNENVTFSSWSRGDNWIELNAYGGKSSLQIGTEAFGRLVIYDNNNGYRLLMNETTGRIVIGDLGGAPTSFSNPAQTLSVRGAGNFSGTVFINNNTDLSLKTMLVNITSCSAVSCNLTGLASGDKIIATAACDSNGTTAYQIFNLLQDGDTVSDTRVTKGGAAGVNSAVTLMDYSITTLKSRMYLINITGGNTIRNPKIIIQAWR